MKHSINKIIPIVLISLILCVCLLATACGKKTEEGSSEPTVSLTETDVKEIVFEKGNLKSLYSLDEALDLSATSFKIYLVDGSQYLTYLQESGAGQTVQSDEKGNYVVIPVTTDMIVNFTSSEIAKDLSFVLEYLGFSESFTYSVFDENSVSVAYELNDGKFATAVYEDVQIKDAARTFTRSVGLPYLIGATKDYYNFDGWLWNDVLVTSIPADITDNEITLVASWTPIEYTLAFVTEFGSVDEMTFTCEDGDEIELPSVTPSTVDDKIFSGWYKDEALTKEASVHVVKPCADTLYYARWSKIATVTLEGEYPLSVRSGSKNIDFSKAYFKVVTSDGEEQIKVTDKSVIHPQFELVEEGKTQSTFIVTYDGMKYECVYSYTVIPSDLYTVTYNTDGGTLPDDAPYAFKSDGLESFPDPEKTGYDFLGWFDSQAFKNQVTSIPENTAKDVVLYAKYSEHVYYVTYVYGEETLEYDDSFTISDTVEGKALWTGFEVEGYHFINWHTSSNISSANVIEVLPVNYTKDVTVYAEMGKKVTSVEITSTNSFDVTDTLTLTANVFPEDAYYKDYVFEIYSDKDKTHAVIENNVLSSALFGVIGIRALCDGVYSEVMEVQAIDNEISTLEILPNDESRYVVIPNADPVVIKFKVGPDASASLIGHTLYFHVVINEDEGNLKENNITIENSVITYTGATSITPKIDISNTDLHGKFTLYAELDPKPDTVNLGEYVFGSGSVVATAVFTVPTPVKNFADLKSIDKDGYYVLARDIDMGGSNWNALCSAERTEGGGLNYANAFNGYFNGNGKTLSNLAIDSEFAEEDIPTVGLFGAIGPKGVVKNFTLSGVYINGEFAADVNIGAAVGAIDRGSVSDVYVSGEISVKGASSVGGVVGLASGIVTNVYGGYEDNALSITLTPIEAANVVNYYYGGVVGYSASGTLGFLTANVVMDVKVYSKSSVYVGGAVGYLNGILQGADILFNGNVQEQGDSKTGNATLVDVGCAVGYAATSFSNVTIGKSEEFATLVIELPDVTATKAGGVVGDSASTLSDCTVYLSATVNSAKALTLGGAFGSAVGGNDLIVHGTFNVASTSTTTHFVGGVGAKSTGDVSGEFYADSIVFATTGDYTFGGLVGDANKAFVGGIVKIDLIDSNSNGATFGGIVGKTTGGILENSTAEIQGEFTTDSKATLIGSLAGTLSGSVDSATAKATITVTAKKTAQVSVGAIATLSNANVTSVSSELTLVFSSEKDVDKGIDGGATLTVGAIAAKATGGNNYSITESSAKLNLTAACVSGTNGSVIGGGAIGDNAVKAEGIEVQGALSVKAAKESTLGGIAGKNSGTLGDCVSEITLIETSEYTECAKRSMGGLVGDNAGAIVHSHSSTSLSGNTSGSGKTASVGGLVGNNTGSINACYVGAENRADKAVKIKETSGSGAVVTVGAFVGVSNGTKADISNCYTEAFVDSNANIGGFAGVNEGKISYSLALGVIENIQTSTTAGAFVYSTSKGTFSECYYNNETDRLGADPSVVGEVGNGVEGYSTTVLKRNDYPEFDADIWDIIPGKLPSIK